MAWRIEPNGDPDVVTAMERAEGWTRVTRETPRRFLADPGGHVLARADDGEVLGVASVTRHGDALAWVSGMIVRRDARGRGVGRALLDACLALADARKVPVAGLDATDLGRRLYARAGFRAVAATSRWARPDDEPAPPPPATPFAVYPISLPELAEVIAFDRERFGASRAPWLAAVLADLPERAFMAFDRATGALGGFALGQERFVGPLVADDAGCAAALLAACERAGTPAMAHLADANPRAADVFRAAGYRPDGAGCVRMARGGDLPGRAGSVFALGSWQTG